MSVIVHPFKPIIDQNSEKLILGTFPSIRSFENYYYGHPRNQFWKILAEVYKADVPQTVEDKIDFILSRELALWDIIHSCRRRSENSSDSNLEVVALNPIGQLLRQYPNIKKIFFTSRTAERLFRKEFKPVNIEIDYLPSPSPAYTALTFDQKVQEWRRKLLR
jgi:hypoxanthine-DNA glycosylase